MTVKEMIEELMKFPLDTVVKLDNGDGTVDIDEIEWNNYYGYIKSIVIK
jgi:hypothetical protein